MYYHSSEIVHQICIGYFVCSNLYIARWVCTTMDKPSALYMDTTKPVVNTALIHAFNINTVYVVIAVL